VTHAIGVFLHDALVHTDAREGIDVAGLGKSYHGVDEHILSKMSSGLHAAGVKEHAQHGAGAPRAQ
jgi:hypothetical protein